MTEDTLREIVERRWPRGEHSCWSWDMSSGGIGSTQMDNGGRMYRAGADAPTVEEVRAMLAAAICAPKLWALVATTRAYLAGDLLVTKDVVRAALVRLPEETP